MSFVFSFKKNKRIFQKISIFGLVSFLSFSFFYSAHATVYQPGQTLEPDCTAGSANCGVATTTSVTAGGTGITSYNIGDLLYASGVAQLSKLAVGADGQILKVSGGNIVWGSGIGANIGDTDLTLTGPRTLTLDGNALTFHGTGGDIVFNNDGSINGSAQNLTLARVGSSTFSTLQEMQNVFHSAGWTSGGTITDAGGETINVSAGTGLLRPSNSAISTIYYADYPAVSGILIPTNSTRYIGVEYNGGTPEVSVRTSSNWNYKTDFPIGVVVNEGGVLNIFSDKQAVGDHASNMVRRDYETMPLEPDVRNGGLVFSETGTRNIAITAGAIWDRLNRYEIPTYNTSISDNFDAYYMNGSGGFTKVTGLTQWPNTKYDDESGTLATLADGKYGVLWFYVDTNAKISMVYGMGQHDTAGLANSEMELPVNMLPPRLSTFGRLIGKIVFQKSASSSTITSALINSMTGSSGGVTDHAGLSDLDYAHSGHTGFADAIGGVNTNISSTTALTSITSTSTGITITGSGASTWSTDAGDLTIDSAGTLNLGTVNAAAVSIGKAGVITTHNGNLKVVGDFSTPLGTELTTIGTQNNVALSAGGLFRYSGVGAATFTGIAGGTDGKFIRIINISGSDITFNNQDTNSTNLNRIITTNGSNATIPTNSSIGLQYDATAQRWRVVDVPTNATSLAAFAYEQNGNAFGTTATLGTTDTNGLNFITAGNTRFSIDAAAATFTGTGATTFAGGSTLALTSAAGSALNITSGTTGALGLDSGSTGAINLGTGSNAKTITIGNTTGATALVLNSGTGGVTLTGLARFANASTSLLSSYGPSYFGGTATSSFSSAGVLTLAGLSSSGLAVDANGRVYAAATTTAGDGLSYGSGAFSLNLGNANTWTALQQFSNASTTNLTTSGTLWIGGLSTTTNGIINTQTKYQIAGTDVLSSNTLGSGITNSSLTSVGTLGTLTVSGQTTLGNASSTLLTATNALYVNGNTFSVNSSGNVNTSGTITSGLVNGQTISSAANFTGTLTTAGLLTASNGLTLTTGTLTLPTASIADAALSSNVALLNRASQTFSGVTTLTNASTTNLTTSGTLWIGGLSTTTNGVINTQTKYQIAGTDVLSSNTLGSGITNSSLTSVGTLGTLTVSGQTALGQASSTLFSNTGTAYFGGTATTTISSTGVVNIPTGATYQVNGTNVLSSNTLGSGITNSSLTSVGTLGTLTVSGQTTLGNASSTLLTATNALYVNGNTFSVNSSGNVNTSGTITSGLVNGQTISSAANFTGTLTTAGLLTASNGLTLTTGTLTLPTASIADAALSSNVALLNRAGQTFAGANTFSSLVTMASTSVTGNTTLSGDFITPKGSDYPTTGSQNNVNLGSGSLFRYTGASTATFTGIAGGVDGKQVRIINASGSNLVLTNNDSSSTAGNRILTSSGSSLTIPSNVSVGLQYDSGVSAWRVVVLPATAGTLSGFAYIQGGNGFGTTATLGTTDANGLDFITGGATRFSIAAGSATLTGTGATSITSSAALSLDATTGLSLGTTNATSITIGKTGVTTTNTGSLTSTQTLTASNGLTLTTGALNLAASSGAIDLHLANISGASPLVFEGATIDGTNKTTFAITDPTGVRTITFPDASITVNAAGNISGTTLASNVVTSSLTTVGTLSAGAITSGFGAISTTNNITTSANISSTGSGTITSAGTLTASNGLTQTTGSLNLTATAGALSLSGLSASSISSGVNDITFTSGHFNTTATGINSTAIGQTTAAAGKFTTLTSTGATDLANAGASNVTIATTGTGNVTVGNSTGTFALTSSGGLNVTTSGALTGVASVDTIALSATAATFAGAGTVSSTGVNALTLDAGTSGVLNLNNNSTGNILIGGGSGSTGCTITNATGALACAGAITGSNLSGTNTGDQTTITGNAGTATALQTARTINGTSFDGTANITVTAAAGTLTGATLNSGVTASSLTSIGTLSTLTVSGQTTLGQASSTLFSNIGTAYFGGTATTTISSTGVVNIPTGATYQINGTNVLSSNTLGSGITASSLTSVGTLAGLTVSGGTANINIAGTSNTAIGNSTGTFALTSSGGLNVTTGGALTGVASVDTIALSATAMTFAGAGTISSTGASNLNLLAGTGNLTIGTSDTTGTLLVLDTKTGSGDPTGVNGGMYYNSNSNKFRCFENSAWTDCLPGSNASIKNASTTTPLTLTATQAQIVSIAATPTLNTNQMWVTADGVFNTDGATRVITLQIMRGGTSCTAGSPTQVGTNVVVRTDEIGTNSNTYAVSFVDSPATTAATTYRLCAASAAGSPTSQAAQITVLEVKTGADLAEIYYSNDSTVAPGEVVSIDPNHVGSVSRSLTAHDKNILGVISTEPGMVIGGGPGSGQAVMVALTGRVPVIVNNESGAIKVGDYLTSSSIPGQAMKATNGDMVIGQALSSFSGTSTGRVMMFVKNMHYSGDVNIQEQNLLLGDISSAIASSTNNGLSGLVTGIQSEASRDPIGIFNQKILSGTEFLTDFVAARITAIRGYFDEIFTKKAHTEQICLKKSDGNEVCVNGDQINSLLQNSGITPTIVSPVSTSTAPQTQPAVVEQSATTTSSGTSSSGTPEGAPTASAPTVETPAVNSPEIPVAEPAPVAPTQPAVEPTPALAPAPESAPAQEQAAPEVVPAN